MERLAFKMQLKPGAAAEYVRRHEAIWPELKQLLTESGISAYSIFLDSATGTLFAYQKVSGSGGSQDLKENPIVQKWWEHMADLMEVHPDQSPVSTAMKEVFYLE